MENTRRMLLVGIVMPIFYFIVLYGFALINPDYNSFTQFPSEIGAIGAPYRYGNIFNICVIITGMMGVVAGVGLYRGMIDLRLSALFAVISALTLIMPSINMIMSGVFPLPHDYHSLLEVIFPVFFAPLMAGLIAKKLEKSKAVIWLLYLCFPVNIVIFAGVPGLGEYLPLSMVGFWARVWVTIIMVISGYLCWLVLEKIKNSIKFDPSSMTDKVTNN